MSFNYYTEFTLSHPSKTELTKIINFLEDYLDDEEHSDIPIEFYDTGVRQLDDLIYNVHLNCGEPISFFETLSSKGFIITNACFIDTDNQTAGTWNDEDGENMIEFDFGDENWRYKIDDSNLLDIMERMETEFERFESYEE